MGLLEDPNGFESIPELRLRLEPLRLSAHLR